MFLTLFANSAGNIFAVVDNIAVVVGWMQESQDFFMA